MHLPSRLEAKWRRRIGSLLPRARGRRRQVSDDSPNLSCTRYGYSNAHPLFSTAAPGTYNFKPAISPTSMGGMIGTSSRFFTDEGIRSDPFGSVQPAGADGPPTSPVRAGAEAMGEGSAKTGDSPLARDRMRPGPGAYNQIGSLGPQPLSTAKTSYGYSMGKLTRPDPTGVGNLAKKLKSPGPGEYNLSTGYGASPNSTVKSPPMTKFGLAPRSPLLVETG